MMTLCSDYLKKLAAWESELCKQRAMDNFDKLREVTTVEPFICEAKIDRAPRGDPPIARGCHGDALHKRRNGRASS